MPRRKRRPFIDAQKMHKLHPDTFQAPSMKELKQLQPGDFIKVCPDFERFWIRLDSVDAKLKTWAGNVDNELFSYNDHGYNYGYKASGEFKHIYDFILEGKRNVVKKGEKTDAAKSRTLGKTIHKSKTSHSSRNAKKR